MRCERMIARDGNGRRGVCERGASRVLEHLLVDLLGRHAAAEEGARREVAAVAGVGGGPASNKMTKESCQNKTWRWDGSTVAFGAG